jgi:hypothetical protein
MVYYFILIRILAGILHLGNVHITPGGGRGDNESSIIQVQCMTVLWIRDVLSRILPVCKKGVAKLNILFSCCL